jgi:hypothetical protein
MGDASGKTGATIAGVSGALLLIFMFALNWYEIDVPPSVPSDPNADLTFNALDAFDIIDFGLLAVALIGVAFGILGAFREDWLAGPASLLTAAAGIAGLVVILIRAISPPTLSIDGIVVKEVGGVEIVTAIGAYLGLAALLGIAAGGVLAMRATGTTLGSTMRKLERALGEDETQQPPPADPAA